MIQSDLSLEATQVDMLSAIKITLTTPHPPTDLDIGQDKSSLGAKPRGTGCCNLGFCSSCCKWEAGRVGFHANGGFLICMGLLDHGDGDGALSTNP